MTGLPVPPRKKRTKKAKKRKQPTAKEVQDETVTAEQVTEEATTIPHDKPEPPPEPVVEIIEKKLTNRVFACLWKGEGLPKFSNNVYGPYYVECLMRGVRRHVPNGQLTVLCDETYYPILTESKKLRSVRVEKFHDEGVGGWSRIFDIVREGLRPKLGKRHVWMGLDTVLMGNCQWIFDWDKSPVGLPLDPYHAPKPCNGVWTFNYEGAAFVADAYEVAKQDGMKDYTLFGRPSEMVLLRYLYEQEKWQPLEDKPRKILSFKVHLANLKNPLLTKATVCMHHGSPKPHQLSTSHPIRKLWEKP